MDDRYAVVAYSKKRRTRKEVERISRKARKN
jgi:hypothetical protein